MPRNIPINKGNYPLDTLEREAEFERRRACGWEEEYFKYRRDWAALPQRFEVTEYPLLVDMELSTICNLRCPFCYTITDDFKEKVDAGLMDFDLYKKVIDEIGGRVVALRLSLRGEPMLHPRFIDAIRYAKERGVNEVSTLTNGSKLTPEFFEETMEAGIDWITVSFDGLYEEYEKNRYPQKFDVMYVRLRSIKKIKEKNGKVKPVIKIQSVWPAIRDNPSEFYNMMSKVSDLVAFNPIIDFAHSTPFEDIEFEEDFSCPQLYQRLVVGADGLVMMCSNDEESEHIIGDARSEKIHDIWHGEKLNEVRALHKKNRGFKEVDVCRKCYLPRETTEEVAEVNGRRLTVRNYVT